MFLFISIYSSKLGEILINIIKGEVEPIFSLSGSDILAIIGLSLDVIAIVITIIIFKITNATSQKVFEDSIVNAIVRYKTQGLIAKDSSLNINYSRNQRKKIKKKLRYLFKHNSSIKAIELAILLKRVIREEQFINLVEWWRSKGFINWEGDFESTSTIYLLDEIGIYESLNSRKS